MTVDDAARPPIISILIPAYNHAAGVWRALESLGPALAADDVEVVVSDDSTLQEHSDAIKRMVSQWPSAVYRHNAVPLGPVRNWNDLLQQARGEYCLILHHDEHFESPAVFESVRRCLDSVEAPPDGIVLPCKVLGHGGRLRLNMPVRFAEVVVTRWPGYLFRRNLIGAPSVLILRRSMYPPFDDRLRWMVDVELYVRVLVQHRPRLVFFRSGGVVSDATLGTSITATLRPEIKTIRRQELSLLRQSGGLSGPGSWLVSESGVAQIARLVEYLAWMSFRGAMRGTQALLALVATRSKRLPISLD